jgi:hypothetical protein
MYTEEEAKNRVCHEKYPIILGAIFRSVGMSEIDGAEEKLASVTLCVASECMAWRWVAYRQVSTMRGEPIAPDLSDGRQGYCGLAGKP